MKTQVAVFMLVIAGFALANDDYTPVGMDMRAYSMGNCIATESAGPAAILRNPAGIGWMERGAIVLTANANVLGGAGYDEEVYDSLGMDDYKFSRQPHANIQGIAFATPIPADVPFDLIGGVAWGQFFDFSGKTKETYKTSSTNTEYENAATYKGGFHLLMPTVAARFADNYVVGMSYGFALFSNCNEEYSSETDNPSSESESEIKQKTTGSMLQIGAQGRFADKLTVGFSYVPAFKMKFDDRKYKDDSGSYDLDDVKYEFPAFVAFGASYDFTPDVTVAAEYQNRPWDDTEINNSDSGIENGSSIRFGLEYRGPVALRAGFYTEKIMTPAEPGDDAPASSMGITAGAGVALGPVDVDFGAYYDSAHWEANPGTGKTEDFKTYVVGIGATASYSLDLFNK